MSSVRASVTNNARKVHDGKAPKDPAVAAVCHSELKAVSRTRADTNGSTPSRSAAPLPIQDTIVLMRITKGFCLADSELRRNDLGQVIMRHGWHL